ncbi:MAG: hypothetical protein DRJ05_15820, partial [Bacteroidetes bacterium]
AFSFGQSFTNINAGLTGLHWSDVAWGDYDNDGDLDALVAGYTAGNNPATKLYKNEGSDNFSEVSGLPIPGTYIGDFAWGDFDGDGDIDILIQGYTSNSQITKLYKNTGEDTFIETAFVFPALADGSVSFVDFNNDGYLDLFLAGYDGNSYLTKIFKNANNIGFVEIEPSLPGAIKSAYEWADYDNDGDMDCFVTGLDNSGALISKLFQNNGDETFTETTNIFTGAWLGDVAWGDYNSDGFPDILLTGFENPGRIAEVYKNNGDGTFTFVETPELPGVSHSSSIWGDFDNDGDLDIFIGGTYEGSGTWPRVTDVFLNNGDDTFSALGLDFPYDSYWGESAWGDYDADGDLDLICSGHDDAGGSNTIIYRNDGNTTNNPPSVPAGLTATFENNTVSLNWDQSTDNETSQPGLTYNLYIRNEDGNIIWNSMANENGHRLLPALGNACQNTAWQIGNLDEEIYYWSVQAIDNNFEGSGFASEQSFGTSLSSGFDLQNEACIEEIVQITYTGTGTSNGEYFWDFGVAVINSGSGIGPYEVYWETEGTKQVSLYVIENGETSGITENNIGIFQFPDDAGDIVGYTEVCQGYTGIEYSIPQISNATSYNWDLPEGIEIINGSGTNIISVDFSENAQTGDFIVSAINYCGIGEPSSLSVYVNPLPEIPETPIGPDTVASNITPVTEYTSNGSPSATSYFWDIMPENAGTISGSSSIGIVEWSVSYTGTALIRLLGINDCGQSDYSGFFETYVDISTHISDNPNKKQITKVYPNPTNGLVEINIEGFENTNQIIVYNSMGKEITSISKIAQTNSLDLSAYGTGLYFIQVITENEEKIFKVTVR